MTENGTEDKILWGVMDWIPGTKNYLLLCSLRILLPKHYECSCYQWAKESIAVSYKEVTKVGFMLNNQTFTEKEETALLGDTN